MATGTGISIITLNVDGLNAPTKDTDWLSGYKNKTHMYAVRPQDTDRLKVRGCKNIFHANGKQKKAGVAILISNNNNKNFKIKITRDKEGHCIMTKGSIQTEEITIVNIYAPNMRAPQYIRQTLKRHKSRSWQ